MTQGRVSASRLYAAMGWVVAWRSGDCAWDLRELRGSCSADHVWAAARVSRDPGNASNWETPIYSSRLRELR